MSSCRLLSKEFTFTHTQKYIIYRVNDILQFKSMTFELIIINFRHHEKIIMKTDMN